MFVYSCATRHADYFFFMHTLFSCDTLLPFPSPFILRCNALLPSPSYLTLAPSPSHLALALSRSHLALTPSRSHLTLAFPPCPRTLAFPPCPRALVFPSCPHTLAPPPFPRVPTSCSCSCPHLAPVPSRSHLALAFPSLPCFGMQSPPPSTQLCHHHWLASDIIYIYIVMSVYRN